MDSATKNLQSIKHLLSHRRFKALFIGSAVLVILVLLQVVKQPPPQTMVELFVECKLRSSDLNRIQVALSKAGFRDYQITGNKLLVPQRVHGEYLQALIDHDSIPLHLREGERASGFSNPFLTHSQQISLQRENRKRKLQELLTLLPFVDQAWLEMDDSSERNAYRHNAQSAVVSIRPSQHQPLLEPQIVTIREMVAGAISGINPEQVVVIDLDSGNAFRGSIEAAPLEQKWIAQRANFARQKWLESQLKEALESQPSVNITVLLTNSFAVENEKVAVQQKLQRTEPDIASPSQTEFFLANQEFQSVDGSQLQLEFLYGANGQVSLNCQLETPGQAAIEARRYDELSPNAVALPPQSHVQQVNMTSRSKQGLTDIRSAENHAGGRLPLCRPKFQVLIEVPARILLEPTTCTSSPKSSSPSASWLNGITQEEIHRRFANYQTYVLTRIQPVLELHQDELHHSVDIQLIGIEEVLSDWKKELQGWAMSHWQSLFVLLVGLVLIGLIGTSQTTGSSHPSNSSITQLQSVNGDQWVASSDKKNIHKIDEETEAVKARLSKLIETDPETAARVIEKWIREAA